jgi:predicted transcriptional regulator
MDPIDPIHQFEALSQRQQEVLRWFGQGKSDREISRLLDITENTVRKHLSAVHDKICPDNSIPGHQIRSALMKFWSQVVQTQTPIVFEIAPNSLNEILSFDCKGRSMRVQRSINKIPMDGLRFSWRLKKAMGK